MASSLSYASSITAPVRRKTREVRVGDIIIGGNTPIVIQSMTTTPTTDTQGTVDQIERLVRVNCQIVRVTTPNMADVENLPSIRAEMKRRKISVPLVADVHFLPDIALKACDYVEKVRINPGNFADRKRFAVLEYTDAEYSAELDRVRETFLPILHRAKENGVSLRIGTNHGSLSDRIMNRFGDTPLGMVESSLEFIRIAEDESFRDIVISMKASNPQVMIQAYRLLVAKMNELGMDYPLHLGVTEAGDGEDGRVKSAMGIGSLLADGLGDTIRVSLTEDPEAEIPVAERISKWYAPSFKSTSPAAKMTPSWDFFSYERRPSAKITNRLFTVGDKETVRVRTGIGTNFSSEELEPPAEAVVIETSSQFFKPELLARLDEKLAVVIRLDGSNVSDLRPAEVHFDELSVRANGAWSDKQYQSKLELLLNGRPVWFRVRSEKEIADVVRLLSAFSGKIQAGVEVEGTSLIRLGRLVASELTQAKLKAPIHLHYISGSDESEQDVLVRAPTELGTLLCDGIGDSVEVSSVHPTAFNHRLAFNILQAARLRMSKTEYISCPSCGRTLFDLQETTARIRSRTVHLKGVKIAIMGCIVNGPGEMADADFGYVGSGPGHINLYVGKECVERSIPTADADQRLIDLIKEHGRWVEPA